MQIFNSAHVDIAVDSVLWVHLDSVFGLVLRVCNYHCWLSLSDQCIHIFFVPYLVACLFSINQNCLVHSGTGIFTKLGSQKAPNILIIFSSKMLLICVTGNQFVWFQMDLVFYWIRTSSHQVPNNSYIPTFLCFKISMWCLSWVVWVVLQGVHVLC